MNPKKQEIYCKKCKRVIGTILIHGLPPLERVQYLECDGLVSCRKRMDGEWGYECLDCGSYSLVAPEEVDTVLAHSRVDRRTRKMLLNLKKQRKFIKRKGKNAIEVDGFVSTEKPRLAHEGGF